VKITVLVPCARPQNIPQVVAQFEALKHEDKRLCVVSSGAPYDAIAAALGASLAQPCDLINGPPGKGAALNYALRNSKRLRNSYIVVRDDDDIYTPDSLAEFDAHGWRNTIVAQKRHWARLTDGRLVLFSSGDHSRFTDDHRIWGGNLGFHGSLASRFEFSADPVAQCQHFVRDVISAGGRVWLKSPQGACIVRGEADHLWQAGDDMVRYVFGDGDVHPAADLADLVNAKSLPAPGALLKAPAMAEAHAAELRRLACAS
jgi:glycosyltransferase involved in cell wall biosynthesis